MPNPSIIVANDNTYTITGGTLGFGNLFHSFSEFSILSGQTALFEHPPVENLLVRVTGNSISSINGTLQTRLSGGGSSAANLFLLNPNGIVFGKDARLDLGGSFIASTADRIILSNNSQFSAYNPETPLLSVAAPSGLQFGSNPGTIENQAIIPESTGLSLGLRVSDEKTLGLIGGNVSMPGGVLFGGGTRIELAAIGPNGQVRLNLQKSTFDYAGIPSFRDIIFTNGDFIRPDENNAKINLTARNILVQSENETQISKPTEPTILAVRVESLPLIPLPSDRIDQSCSPNSFASGQFTVAGTSGLPANPQTRTSENILTRLATEPTAAVTSRRPLTVSKPEVIREAQNAQRLANGKIRFTVVSDEAMRQPMSCLPYGRGV